MNERFGVVEMLPRSLASLENGTTCESQYDWLSMIEWKYMNGSWRVAYWSAEVAPCVLSAAPTAGWPHVADSREESAPMPSM